MAGPKVDILWSPNSEDKFVTLVNELNLYRVEQAKEVPPKSQCIRISEDTVAHHISVNSDHEAVKCLAWYPKPTPDSLIAVGLGNGKVVLSSFGKGGSADPKGLIAKEFVPKHVRPCNSLAWNPIETHLLAEGLDRFKSDHSILVWDVYAKSPSSFDLAMQSDRKLSANQTAISKPFVESGTTEATQSLSWFSQNPKCLVSGMSGKFLRIFDLNEFMRPQSQTYTKAVHGVCVDPHVKYRIASFVEGAVHIWDTRSFEKPMMTIQETHHVVKLSWSPVRSGLLAVLPKDSSVVKMYDIQSAAVGSTDEFEPTVIERVVQSQGQQSMIASFDWHKSHENRMISITSNGKIEDVKIFERISVNWAPDIHMSWACGRKLLQCNTVQLCQEGANDISVKMKRRAIRGYGLQNDSVTQNASFVSDDIPLRNFWNWLDHVKQLPVVKEGKLGIVPRGNSRLLGVRAVLKGDANNAGVRSEPEYLDWQGLQSTNAKPQRLIYTSEERGKVLELCGWGTDRDALHILDTLETEGDFERAAAIAVFNLNMRRAINILLKGSASFRSKGESNLNVFAMALSGYVEESQAGESLWKEMCSTLGTQLHNPYLRAMFSFLTSKNETYEEVFQESQVTIMDKVAFASIYLPDAKLVELVENWFTDSTEQGKLDGLLLTGLTREGIDLMCNYVDRTSDIQTATFIMLQAYPAVEIVQDPRVQQWIEEYRQLLDHWCLWHERAEFDIYKSSKYPVGCCPQQVHMTCNFCGKSTDNSMRSNRQSYSLAPFQKMKVSSCPSCRKPLPRCTLCLINMGTASGTAKPKKSLTVDQKTAKLTPFAEWFTWCQTCRHGGHAGHMTDWFRDHSECPVTGCTCKCASQDSVGQVNVSPDSKSTTPTTDKKL